MAGELPAKEEDGGVPDPFFRRKMERKKNKYVCNSWKDELNLCIMDCISCLSHVLKYLHVSAHFLSARGPGI